MKVNIAVCFKPEEHTEQQVIFLMVMTKLLKKYGWKQEMVFNFKDIKVLVAGRQDGGDFAASSFGNLLDYFTVAEYNQHTFGVRLNKKVIHLLNMRTGRKSFSIRPYELKSAKAIALAIYLLGVMAGYGDNIGTDDFQLQTRENLEPDRLVKGELTAILKNKELIPDWMSLICN